MNLLTTIVAFLSVSSVSAAGWGRPRGHDLSIPPKIAKEAITRKIVHKKKKEGQAPLTTTRGGATKAKAKETSNASRLRLIGDIGNVVTLILSVVLLIKSFQVGDETVKCVDSLKCDVSTDSGLDDCYVCDGFCISNPTDAIWNSHMLSLYADTIMSLPLAWLWVKRNPELDKLGLKEYFLKVEKLISVSAHGLGHLGLSLTEHLGKRDVLSGPTARYAVAGIAFSSFLMTPGFLSKLKGLVGQVSAMEDNEYQVRQLNKLVAPFHATIGMTQAVASSRSGGLPKPVGNAILFGVMYILTAAGVPIAGTKEAIIFIVAAAALMTYAFNFVIHRLVGPGGNMLDASGLLFVLVFTSVIVIGSASQLLLWNKEDREERAKPYVITAVGSNLLTTLVGWALALQCTFLKNYTGHMLYDFSISFSYLLIYFFTKYW